jgi:hypothetical protein
LQPSAGGGDGPIGMACPGKERYSRSREQAWRPASASSMPFPASRVTPRESRCSERSWR